MSNNTLEFIYYLAHSFDQAIEQGGKTIELDPSYSPAYQTLGDAYEAKGMPEQAFSSYQKWAEAAGFSAETIAALKQAFESGGMKGYWRKRLEMEEKEEAETGNVWPLTRAQIHARLGERDKAFAWLEKMYSDRHERLHLVRPDPVFDGLHSDPRFDDLLNRIGLPPL
jgi:tetratricopeptide (TPR) repeat protein